MFMFEIYSDYIVESLCDKQKLRVGEQVAPVPSIAMQEVASIAHFSLPKLPVVSPLDQFYTMVEHIFVNIKKTKIAYKL